MKTHPILILLFIACSPPWSSAQAHQSSVIDFTDPIIMPTGISPYFVVAADFNKDGFLDLATSNTVSHTISVFINNGNGTFTQAVNYPTRGFTPYALAVGDLNGDGYPDIVCGNMFSGNISIFINKGDGTFAEATNIPVDPGPMFTVIADLNNDGIPDIATSNIGHDDITVLFNQGNLHFINGGTFKTGGVIPYSMVAADFDRTGVLDLATGNIYSANVSVLKNLGAGKFAEAKTYKTDSLTQILYVADFNNDGYPDIVSGNGGSDNVSVLINDKHGGFLPAVNYDVKLPQGVTAADLNGDGFLDIATANQSANTASILINKGDGTFNKAIDYPVGGLYPISVVLADLNNDGKLDMVTANSGSNNISIFLNGIKIPKVEQLSPSSNSEIQLSADGDVLFPIRVTFNTDMDAASLTGDTIRLVGTQSGELVASFTYDPSRKTLVIAPHRQSHAVQKHGIPPQGSRLHAGEQLRILFSSNVRSSHGITLKGGYSVTYEVGSVASSKISNLTPVQLNVKPERTIASLYSVDLDGDGLLDLVTLNRNDGRISLYFNSASGLSTVPVILETPGETPSNLFFADLGAHGLTDIVVLDRALASLSVLYNEGQKHFSGPTTIPLPAAASDVAIADFNGDGLMDIACVSQQGKYLAILLNQGARQFSRTLVVGMDSSPEAIALADFDRDGHIDIVIASRDTHTLTVYRNDEDGAFQKKEDIVLPDDSIPFKVLTADLNLDGAADIVALDYSSDRVIYVLNNGDGTFNHPSYVDIGTRPRDALIGDLNGSGWPDIVVTGKSGLMVLQNNSGTGFRNSAAAKVDDPRGLTRLDSNQEAQITFIVGSSARQLIQLEAGSRPASHLAQTEPSLPTPQQ